jgi:hypothetical protein
MGLSQIFCYFSGKYFDVSVSVVTGNFFDLIWAEIEEINLIDDRTTNILDEWRSGHIACETLVTCSSDIHCSHGDECCIVIKCDSLCDNLGSSCQINFGE